jgi:3-hydroxyacyl-CoA dehydrogenase
MFHANTTGLESVVASIRALAREHGERYWTPAPLLVTLAGAGSTFSGWQAARQADRDAVQGRN